MTGFQLKQMMQLPADPEMNPDQLQQLHSLGCTVWHYPNLYSAVLPLINSTYGVVLMPGWENDDDAYILVKIAKAFGIPVKTHQTWLQTLPAPPDPNETWDGTMAPFDMATAPDPAYWDTFDPDSGDIIHADATTTAEGAATFVEIVNLDLDILEPPAALADTGQALVQAILDRKAALDPVVVPLTPDEENDDIPTWTTPSCNHTWKTIDGAYGCVNCGAAA